MEVKTYNDLVARAKTNNAIPLIVIVVIFPEKEGEWLDVSEKEMKIRKCAYWYNPKSANYSKNKSRYTIEIPKDNLFIEKTLCLK